MLIDSEMASKTMANPVLSNPVPVTKLGIKIVMAQPKDTSTESVFCIKEEASQSSIAVITVSDKDGSDDFHVTNDFDLVSVEDCDDTKESNYQSCSELSKLIAGTRGKENRFYWPLPSFK